MKGRLSVLSGLIMAVTLSAHAQNSKSSANNLDVLRRLSEDKNYTAAHSLVRLYLANSEKSTTLRTLRLYLWRALLEAHLGRVSDAKTSLAFAREIYSSLFGETKKTDDEALRVKVLAEIEITEWDVNKILGAGAGL